MSDTAATNQPLTVALVHGAFADSSSWNGVIERLENHNVPVTTARTRPGTCSSALLAYALSIEIPRSGFGMVNSIVAGAGIALLVANLLGRNQTLVAVLVGVAATLALMVGVVAYQRWRYGVIEQMVQPA